MARWPHPRGTLSLHTQPKHRRRMSIVETIRTEMTAAMRARDTLRRDTHRLLMAACGNARIELGHELSDDEALRVLQREAKQRRDSIEEYAKGNRQDLVDVEQQELDIIVSYLPAELSDDELDAIVREVIAEAGATAPGDMGKVMGPLMQRVASRADGRRVNELVRELLASS